MIVRGPSSLRIPPPLPCKYNYAHVRVILPYFYRKSSLCNLLKYCHKIPIPEFSVRFLNGKTIKNNCDRYFCITALLGLFNSGNYSSNSPKEKNVTDIFLTSKYIKVFWSFFGKFTQNYYDRNFAIRNFAEKKYLNLR